MPIVSRNTRPDGSIPPDSATQRKKLQLILCGFVTVALVIGALFVAFPKQFTHQIEISTIRQPNPYTQLYFENPTGLPQKLHVDQPTTVDFTVVNDEGRSRIYQYTVTVGTDKSETVIDEGTLVIPDQESATRAVAVLPKLKKTRYLITVSLGSLRQSIHFYGTTS
jgi:hypothetical protein